jgi:hypothetical protein
MKQLFTSLFEVLNKDITFGFRSVEETEEPRGSETDALLTLPAEDDLRFLTVKRYLEQPIKRKSTEPFQLRYKAYGEASNMMCAHTYAWHNDKKLPYQGSPNALSVAIEFDNSPVASATLVFDGTDCGLAAESVFPQEIEELRSKHGHNLCEITSFALSKARRSRRVIAGLLHVMYLYARQAKQMEGMLAVTRLHHVGIYEGLLGFKRLAQRDNMVLVFIPFDVMRTRIRQFGGKPEIEQESAGIYKFFFQAKDEPGLLYRVLEHLAASGTSGG